MNLLLVDLALVAGGLVALFFGGEGLVRGAISLARRLGLSALVISLTVVGFGTSMPELLVSIRAAFAGSPDIALGNVVGSNTANILLILGLCILVAPITRYDASVRRDIVIAMGAALVLFWTVSTGMVTRLTGSLLIGWLVIYLVAAYRAGQQDETEPDEALSAPPLSALATAGWLAFGFVLLFAGAEALVRGSVSIARTFGISEAVIGLTIVAVGTSLPELATSLVAAIRRHGDVALGNVVGSNIFNILGILGIASMIKPIPAAPNFVAFDVPVTLMATGFLALLLFVRWPLGRIAGATCLGAYLVYTVALASGVTSFG